MIFELFISVGNLKPKLVVFQAKSQAKMCSIELLPRSSDFRGQVSHRPGIGPGSPPPPLLRDIVVGDLGTQGTRDQGRGTDTGTDTGHLVNVAEALVFLSWLMGKVVVVVVLFGSSVHYFAHRDWPDT